MQSGAFDELWPSCIADRARRRFEPTVMAQDLAASVEMLSAAIEAIPADRLDHAVAARLVDWLRSGHVNT